MDQNINMLKVTIKCHNLVKEIFLSNLYKDILTSEKNKFRRRSHLFMPLTKLEEYRKNITCGADTIIFDLEDSIPSEFKVLARQNLGLLPAKTESIEYVIRINEYLTKDFDLDIETLSKIQNAFDTVSLSKVECADNIEIVKKILPNHKIIAFMETPIGIRNAFSIAKILGKGDGIGLGAGDYAMRMGISRKPIYECDALKFAAMQVASAAHQYGVDFIDTISRPFGTQISEIILREESIWSKNNTGAVGKRAIHPSQILIINEVFSPNIEDIQSEISILNLFAESKHTNAIKKPENTYSGTPEYKTALNRLTDWFSKGYINISNDI